MTALLLIFLCAVSVSPAIIDSLTEDISIQNELTFSNDTGVRWFWVTENDVNFWLYTRSNPDQYQVLKINDSDSLMRSNFDFNKKVKVIVHGWISNGTSFVPEIIKAAYLFSADLNIIIVDWSSAANSFYILASNYVAMVGKLLTDFLKFLVDEGVSTDDIHLIGHSLGAHVVGIAGGYYYSQRNPVHEITGLDPAYPLYKFTSEDKRLDKTDARHVEVIHSCAGLLGFPTPLGNVDFYPNGGRSQPGCGYDIKGTCAHDRAVVYFAESIVTTTPFTAVRCESYDEVYYNGYCIATDRRRLNMSGLYLNYGEEGVYYLKTNPEPPFALGSPDNWNRITNSER